MGKQSNVPYKNSCKQGKDVMVVKRMNSHLFLRHPLNPGNFPCPPLVMFHNIQLHFPAVMNWSKWESEVASFFNLTSWNPLTLQKAQK